MDLPVAEIVPLQRARLMIEGFELHAERWSGGDRASVLLLHGLGGNSVTWHGVAPALAHALEADVLAVDLPGFGRSRTGGSTLDVRALSRIVEGVLRTEAPSGTRWWLAGNSLGAVLALELACRVPHLVAGVSIAAPALPLYWGRDLRGIAALTSWLPVALPWVGRSLFSSTVNSTGLPGVVDDPIRAMFGDAKRLDPGLRKRLLEVSEYRFGWVAEAARAYEQVTRSLGIELLLPARSERWIREVACPVQAIGGERDPIFPTGAWQKLEQVRPDWRYVVLPDIGHVPQLEAPREVAHCIAQWVNDVLDSGMLRPRCASRSPWRAEFSGKRAEPAGAAERDDAAEPRALLDFELR